ncbi:hypothetical protein BJX61DRAFT_356386 [Aspergillus egyptiacus]|nr:hypothetical protein BJX61DRAFT_356386 [Aspergillus egyptiacus]
MYHACPKNNLVESRLAGKLQLLESRFTISDLEAAWKEGRLLEAFVSGTAFFIKRVSTIRVGDGSLDLPQKCTDFGPVIKGWLSNIMFGVENHEWAMIITESNAS